MRGTSLVVKQGDHQGAPLKFDPLFAVLMLARRGKATPGAPAPKAIEQALMLWPEHSTEEIADKLGVPVEDIEWIGLQDVDKRQIWETEEYLQAKKEAGDIDEITN
jgi:hypothetical protein